MTTFDYTPFDLQNPAGNNGLSSFALYFQRIMYKEAIYPTNVRTPLDTWYDKQYYGRINQLQNTIIPKYENLQTLKTIGRPNLLALNFVVDAFEAFASHIRNATILGVLKTNDTNEKIYDIKAYQAYNDPNLVYNQYTQQLYSSFTSGLSEQRSNEITNFQSFTKIWLSYLENVSSFIPVTKTNYLLSAIANSFNSGLSIGVDLGIPGDDEYKYDNWINDPNFEFYANAAKKFGFTINKNIPWILTADLFSDACLAYMKSYIDAESGQTVTKDNFFEVYYDPTYLTDIDLIKQVTVNAYRTYIDRAPYYQTKEFLSNCDKFIVDNIRRQPLPENIDSVITDKLLIDLYLSLRSKEAKDPVQVSKKLKQELANIYTIRPNKSLTGLQNAAEYINLIYRDYIYEFDYLFLNTDVLNNLDNQVRSGNITTVGSIAQQLY